MMTYHPQIINIQIMSFIKLTPRALTSIQPRLNLFLTLNSLLKLVQRMIALTILSSPVTSMKQYKKTPTLMG